MESPNNKNIFTSSKYQELSYLPGLLQPQTHSLDDHQDTISHAYKHSPQMAIKIKQIRTILGYQEENKLLQQPISSRLEVKNEEKGLNLKNFVASMRKRNDKAYHTLSHRRNSSMSGVL